MMLRRSELIPVVFDGFNATTNGILDAAHAASLAFENQFFPLKIDQTLNCKKTMILEYNRISMDIIGLQWSTFLFLVHPPCAHSSLMKSCNIFEMI